MLPSAFAQSIDADFVTVIRIRRLSLVRPAARASVWRCVTMAFTRAMPTLTTMSITILTMIDVTVTRIVSSKPVHDRYAAESKLGTVNWLLTAVLARHVANITRDVVAPVLTV